MPDDGFQVSTDALGTHAGRVDQIGGQVGTAKGAGEAVRMDYGAYGQLCIIVPALLSILQDKIIEGLGEAVESLRQTAEDLRGTAETYQSTDESIQNDMTRTGGALGGPR